MTQLNITITSANGIQQAVAIPTHVSGQAVKIKAQAHSKFNLTVDGVPAHLQSANAPVKGRVITLKRVGKNLLIEKEGEPLLEILDFYVTEGAVLEGHGWNFAPHHALVQTAEGVAASPETVSLLGDVTTLGASGLGLAMGGVGLGAALGGGGGAAAAPVTVAKFFVAAGPVIAGHQLTIDIYDVTGKKIASGVKVNADGSAEVTITGTYDKLIAVVKNNGEGADYHDETTKQAVNLSMELMGMGTAETVNGNKVVTINLNPLSTLAAQQAGIALTNGVPSAPTQDIAATLKKVAELFGVADINAIVPELVIAATGEKNTNFNDTDAVSGAERYGQVLAMLSGLDSVNGGDVRKTLADLNAALNDALAGGGDTAALKEAVGDWLIKGAVEYEFNNTGGTQDFASLLSAAGVKGAGETSTPSKVTDLLVDLIEHSADAQVLARSVEDMQALTDTVNALQTLAALAPGAVIPQALKALLSVEKLNAAGLEVTQATLDGFLRGVQNAVDDGTGTNTYEKLQALLDVVEQAARAITEFANQVSTSSADGNGADDAYTDANSAPVTAPTLLQYADAGVTGVTQDNLAAINDALATGGIDGAKTATAQDVQVIVTAYAKILAEANDLAGTAGDFVADATASDPTAADYAAIGAGIGAAATDTDNLALLNDIVGGQNSTGVDTVKELENLAAIANAIQAVAQGTATPAQRALLTPSAFEAIGITGVTPDNLASFLTQIGNKDDSGNQTDSLSKLQTILDDAVASLAKIGTFAEGNAASSTDGNAADDGYTTGAASKPTVTDFANVGVIGVNAGNLAAINDALATAMGREDVSTQAGIQTLVNAYSAILAAADGIASTGDGTIPALTADQYGDIGTSAATQALVADAQGLKLLNDIIGAKASTAVDTVAEIDELARIAKAMQDVANGVAANPALTPADFAKLGINGVTADNLAAVLKAIGTSDSATPKTGVSADTLAELQALVTQTTAAISALSAFAEANAASSTDGDGSNDPYALGSVIPSDITYTQAGIVGTAGAPLTAVQVAAVNDALATSAITGAKADTPAKVQTVVNAYLAILDVANGVAPGTGTPADTIAALTAQQYADIGANIGAAATDAQNLQLLNDAVGRKPSAGVDTVKEIEDLARVVNAIQAIAAGASPASISPALAKEDLAKLGVVGVTDDNLGALLQKIQDAANDGTGTQTVALMEAMVGEADLALGRIADFAQRNTLSSSDGDGSNDAYAAGSIVPTLDDYTKAGVQNLVAANVAAYNDALATAPLTAGNTQTLAGVQTVVSAYNAIIAAADGAAPAGTTDDATYRASIPALSAQQYADIGANIGDAATVPANLKLLNDAVGRKASTGVDTVKEIEALARVVNAIQAIAGGQDPATISPSLTKDDLLGVGIVGVTADNLGSVLTQIGKKADDGSATDTLAEIDALVAATQTALGLIQGFAQNNAASQALPDDGSSSQYTGDAGLSAAVFADAGIVGVTPQNLRSIKDALATAALTGDGANSQAEIQKIVDAYNAIRSAADGSPSTGDADIPALTLAQYTAIGLDATVLAGLGDSENLKLLNDVVGGRSVTAVDTANELNNLGRIVLAIQAIANGQDPSTITPALTAADLAAIGMQGVTNGNLKAVLAGIGDAANDGSGTDTLADLNAIAAHAQDQLAAISGFADLNATASTTGDGATGSYTGTAPNTTTYKEAGVTGVDGTNLAAINDALAGGAITGAKADTVAEIQTLVDSYNNILKAADGGAVGSPGSIEPSALIRADFTNIGVNLGAAGATPAGDAAFALMQDLMGKQSDTGVDTVAEVQKLVDIANALQALADGTATPTQKALLSPDNLSLIGLQNVSADNIGSVLEKIEASTGDLTNSLSALQGLVDGVNTGINTLTGYAANPQTVNTDPSTTTYTAAGVEGVDGTNLAAINAALKDTQANPSTPAGVQAVVDSYNKILGQANGSVADATATDPVASDYTNIGVDLGAGTSATYSGTDAATDAQTLALLNDVIGGKATTDVDTPDKIEELVKTVNALQALANLEPNADGSVTIPAELAAVLTKDALNTLGITPPVTDATLASVLAAIVKTDNSGGATDSVAELSALVGGVTNALNTVSAWAADPQTSTTAPTVSDYANIGVTGVDASNRAAINSALADADVHPTDAAGVQAVVNAYNNILKAADSGGSTGTDPSTLTAGDFTAIGVNLDSTPSRITSAANDPETLALLKDLVGNKDTTGVDTVAELQNLADTVNAIQALAALNPGDAIPQWITDQLTPANLTKAGLQDVSAGNLAGVLAGIQAADNSGGSTDGLSELNTVVTQVNAAAAIIADFADNNASSKPLPTDSGYGAFNYVEGSAALSEVQFIAAGVKNVTAANVASIKDALATASITSSSINTTTKLQTVVDAFLAIRDAADGTTGTSIPVLSQSQYAAIGISSALATGLNDAENLRLMNDIIGSKTTADVDTVAEINNLARIVKGIQDTAAGLTATPALTSEDLIQLGITGVTTDNLASVLTQIGTASTDGSQTSRLADLQTVINSVNFAPTNTVSATVAVNEDTGPHYLNGLGVSDGDIGSGQITVVLTAPNGTMAVVAANGTTVTVDDANHRVTLVGTQAQINAALSASNNIAWTPVAGYYGTANISMATTDTAAAGTSNGHLTDTDNITITVASVADAPTGSAKTVTINEDGSYSFSASDFGFADNEGVMPANAFTELKITTLPTVGTLTLNGTAVTAGQTVASSALGGLVYTPAANASGTAYANFTFQVIDNGVTSNDLSANGGVNIDATARTFTLNVNPVAEITSTGVAIHAATGALNNLLSAGDTVTVMVTFDQAVTVTGTGTNSPSIDLEVGGAVVKAYYDAAASDLATGKVAFSYAILANQLDADGIAIPASGIKLNTGAILSVGSGAVPAVLEHALVGANGSYKVDAVNPLLSFITGTLKHDGANDSGTSSSDSITKTTTPTLTGTVEAGASVRVTVGGTTYDSLVDTTALSVDGSGRWTLVIPAGTALTDASAPSGTSANAGTVYSVHVTSVDAAGNATTQANAFSFTLDTHAPTAVNVTGQLALISDTGVGADNVTSQVKPTLTGTAEAGSVVTVKITVPTVVDATGVLTYTTTAGADGRWTVNVAQDLSTGSALPFIHTFAYTVTSTDAAGNAQQQTGTPFTVNTSDPTGNAHLKIDATNDTAGVLTGTTTDTYTQNTTPVIEGTIGDSTTPYAVGDQVKVVLGGSTYSSDAAIDSTGAARITITSGGAWSFSAAALAAGDYMPSVSVKGFSQSNYGTALNGTGFRVDTSVTTFGVTGALTIDADANSNTADDNDSAAKGDNITRDTTPTLHGTAEANSTVKITLNGVAPDGTSVLGPITLPNTLVGGDGTWSVTVPSALANGTWTPSIVVNDNVNNDTSTPRLGTAFTVDNVAPAGQTGALASTSDSGNALSATATDLRTKLSTPTLSGTAEKGATVDVSLDGGTTWYTTTAHASTGDWSVSVTSALADSGSGTTGTSFTPQVRVTDKAGNVSTVDGTAFVLDAHATADNAIAGGLPNGSGGYLASTTSTTPTLTGTAEAGAVVVVVLAGKTYSSAVTGSGLSLDGSGQWTLVVPVANHLAAGSYTPQITVTDAAGNLSNTIGGTPFNVVISLTGELNHVDGTSDTAGAGLLSGAQGSTTDNHTRQQSPTLTGETPPNSRLEITLSQGATRYTYTIADTGTSTTWSQAVTDTLVDGNWTVALKATNLATQAIVNATGTPFSVDHTAPSVLSADLTGGLTTGVDSGSKGDGLTNGLGQTTVLLSGTGEPGAAVSIDVKDGAATVGSYTGQVSNLGQWSITGPAFSALTSGHSYAVNVTLTDAAGNASSATTVQTFTFDSAAPSFSAVAVSGLDASGNAKSALLQAGETVVVTATALEKVNVSGKPTYAITLGSSTVSAVYDADASLAADATGKTLVFKYLVKTNDVDTDGLGASAAAMALSGGVIRDDAGNAADLSATGVPALSANSLTVDAKAPTVNTSSIVVTSNAGADNSYKAGDTITFKVVFSEQVQFSDNAGVGLNFRLGSATVTAASDPGNTASGTDKTFRYTVLQGETDADGISLVGNPVIITGTSSILDAAGNNAVLTYAQTVVTGIATHLVDTTPPVVAIGATPLALNLETGTTASTISFTFSEDPLASFDLSDIVAKDSGGNTLTAGSDFTWGVLSATGLVRTVTLTPAAGKTDTYTVSVANNTFQDVAGNANADGADSNNSLSLAIDTARPTVAFALQSAAPVVGYKRGDTVTLTLTFSEEVSDLATTDIAVSNGTGTLSNLVQVDATHWSVDFKPANNQAAGTSIQLAIANNAFKDLRGNWNADALETNNQVSLTVDTENPTITVSSVGVTSTAPRAGNTTYKAGDTITFSVTFSEAVQFSDTAVGLNFKLGSSTVTAASVAGNTSLGTVKTFSYTVLPGELDNDGLSLVGSPVVITGNTTTIQDAAGNNAVLAYTQGTLTGIAAHKVDTIAPALSTITGTLKQDIGNDTGTVGDFLTKNATPTLTGAVEAGASVRVTVGGKTYDSQVGSSDYSSALTVTAGGVWTLVIPGADALVDGSANGTLTANSGTAFSVDVSATDAAGNATTSTGAFSFTLDTRAAATADITGALKTDILNDSGVSGDNRTNIAAPTLTGVAEKGATVKVTVGAVVYTTTANASSGVWSVALGTLTDGTAGTGGTSFTPTIEVTDKAGNTTTSVNATAFILDTKATPASSIAGGVPNGSGGYLASVNSAVPTLTGTAEAGAGVVVTVVLGNVSYKSSAVGSGLTLDSANGHWSLTVPALYSLTPGSYTPQIIVTDAAGNISNTQSGTPFVVSLSLNGALDSSTDSAGAGYFNGVVGSTSDALTKVTRPKLSGQAPSNNELEIVLNGKTYSSKSGDANYSAGFAVDYATGVWSFTVPLADALSTQKAYAWTLTATNRDNVNNVITTNGTPFTLDTTAPVVLTGALQVDNASDTTPMDNTSGNDTGVKGDHITADNTPTLSGTAEAGAMVTVTLTRGAGLAAGNGSGTQAATFALAPVLVAADGTWSVTVPNDKALADGGWTPSIVIADAAGNTATAVDRTAFTIDTTAPVLSLSATRAGGVNHGAAFSLGSDKLLKGEGLLVTFAFDDDIIGDSFTQGDLTVTGGVLSNFSRMSANLPVGAKAAWTANYTPTDGVDNASGGIIVAAGALQNVVAVAFGAAVAKTIGYDTSAPDIVSIQRGVAVAGASGQSGTYNNDLYLNKLETDASDDKATFLVKFTQAVTGVSANNFVLKDLGGNTIAGATCTVTGGGTDWTISVGGLDTLANVSGVRLHLANRAGIADAAGNALTSISYGNGQAYTVDQVAPALASLTSSTTVGTGTPLLNGRAEAGAALQVQVGTAVYSVTANDSGVWTLDTASATRVSGTAFTLTDGGNVAVVITPIDAAGNSGTATETSVTRANGTPVISTAGVTNDATPTVEGTTTANSWVRVNIGGASYDVQANASGIWVLDTGSRTPTSGSFNEVTNGNYAITAQTVSGNGGTVSGATATSTLLIDTLVPGAPVITSSPYTSDSTPLITGAASAGAKVRVSINGSSYDILTDATGMWALDITTATSTGTPTTTVGVRVSGGGWAMTGAAGAGTVLTNALATGSPYAVTAREIDAAGNQSPTVTQTLVFDNQAPVNPTIDAGTVLTSGNTSPVVSGTGEAGAQITLVISGGTYQTTVGSNGRWSVATASETPIQGAYVAPASGSSVTAYVRQSDAAGNINAGSTNGTPTAWTVNRTYTYDNTYPAITSADFTNDTTPVVSGTGPAGAVLDIVISGATYRTTVGADGKWSINTEGGTPISGSFTALSSGQSYPVTATITSTTKTTGQNLTVDTQTPITLTINAVTGDDFISQVEKGNVSITGTAELGTSVSLNFAGNVRTATVKADGTWSYQLASADYALLGESVATGDMSIIATAKDKAGNQLIRTRNFTIDTFAPVVDLDRASASSNNSLALTAKNLALSLDNGDTLNTTDASVTEVSSINAVKIGFQRVTAAGAVVGFAPQDGANEQLLIGDQVLNINGTNLPTQLNYGGVVWYIDYAAGSFTLTAASGASTAAGQAMLRNIRYINKDSSSTSDDDNRVLSFQLVDKAGNTSTAVTSTVSADALAPVLDLDTNDSSTATAGGYKAAVTGTTAARLADTDLVLNEASNGNSKIASIEVTVAGLQDGVSEKLLADTATGTLASGWAANGAGFSNGATFTLGGKTWAASYNSARSTFSFQLGDGSLATDAQAQSLIDALRYQNTAATATDGARSFKFTVTDGVGNAMAVASESVLSYAGAAPAVATAGTLSYTAATRSNTNGQVTMFDANGDGVMGDQFTVTFTEAVKASNVLTTGNWNAGGADALLGTGWSIAANNSYTVGADTFAKSYNVNRGTGGSLSTGSQLYIANSNVLDTTGTAASGTATKAVRFIMLRNANVSSTFDLNEVAVYVGATNVALNKTVTVGTQGTNSTYPVSRLVDGNTTTDWVSNSNSNISNAWVQIDLGGYYVVDKVVVNGRAGVESRMSNTAIYASAADMSVGTQTNTTYNSNPDASQAILLGTIGAVSNGAAAQTFGTGGVAFTNPISTVGGASGAVQVFNMTDIVAPVAPTPPLNLATDNVVNVTEEAGNTDVKFDHAYLVAGDVISIYRDGVDITSSSGVSVVGGGVLGSNSTTFRLTDAAWGAEGGHSFSVRVTDAAGNQGVLSAPKAIVLDTAVTTGIAAAQLLSDAAATGTASVGDVIRLTFNEPVNLRSSILETAIFGTGAVAVSSGAAGGAVLVNPTFNTGFGSWTAAANTGTAPTASAGAVLFSNAAGNQGGTLSQTFTTVAGQSYSVSYQQTGAAAIQVDALNGTTPLGSGLTSSANGTFSYNFTATGTSTTLRFTDASSITGTNVVIDNVVLAGGGNSKVWDITLGSNPVSSLGQGAATAVSLVGATDVGGNSSTVVKPLAGNIPANLYATPGSILIDNVSTDNVIASGEAGTNSVDVKLTGAAVGDVVKLYMDGVLVATKTLASGDLTTANVSFNNGVNWGADGTRALTASIQRGVGTVLSAPERSVYVTADGLHWSSVNANTIWFDPDTLVQTNGTAVAQWNANVGKTASGGALWVSSSSGSATGNVVFSRDATGHVQLIFDGQSQLNSNDTITVPTLGTTGYSDFSLFKLNSAVNDYKYTLTRYIGAGGSTLYRHHFGTAAGGYGLTSHMSGDGGGVGLTTPSNSSTVNNWTVLNGYSTGSRMVLASDNRDLATRILNGTASGGVSAASLTSNATNAIIIGNTDSGGSYINALMADQIMFNTAVTAAQATEVATYLAVKYQSVGVPTTVNGTNKYDLSSSASSASLIDDRLLLNTAATNDTVTVAGADYVNAGAGNDTLYAKDMKFRTLDGGQGFDTFALSSSYSNTVSGSSFVLADYVSNARGTSGVAVADARVNAAGYHKLLGFEKLDFSQATEKQSITIALADIDQLAEKGLAQGTNVTADSTTSHLFAVLGSNDWLDATTSGLGNVTYGFYQDANGMAYDRRYGSQNNVGTDEAYLYVRGGDDAPDFGATSTTAVVGATSVTVDLSEVLGNFSGTAANWTVASAGSSLTAAGTAWSTGTTAGKTTLTLTGSFNTAAYLDITYTGTALVDSNGDQLRYKGLAIGIATADNINLSGKSAATNAVLGAGYAIFGNDGKDTIIGSSWDDLLVGGAGNDQLTGGLGADIFRAIQFEGGIDTVTDFAKSQGDKIDLRGILQGTAMDDALVWNADGSVNTTSLVELSKYVEVSTSGTTVVLKVDDNGLSGFAAPGYQVVLQSTNVADNLGAMDLQSLINQRVILA